MSLYNLINGVNSDAFFVLPMLGKHPDEYPRFRDCFTSDEDRPDLNEHIFVYTRVGGGNRDSGFGEEVMQEDEHFVCDYDDDFDSTYATYVFRVPERWLPDYRLIREGKVAEVSEEYQREVRRVFPKLREQLNTLWPATAETGGAS